jgi:hypothetical protein
MYARFSFEYADTTYEGPWGFHTDGEASHQVMGLFCHHGRRKWNEIWSDQTGSRRRHKKHHFQPVDSLCDEAQKRLGQLRLDEVFESEIFRFRDGGLGRLWGFVVADVFHVVWWDPEHRVCPTDQD